MDRNERRNVEVRKRAGEECHPRGRGGMWFKELQMELGRKGSKRSFKDISNWQVPPSDEGEEEVKGQEEAEPPPRRPLLDHHLQPADDQSAGDPLSANDSVPDIPSSSINAGGGEDAETQNLGANQPAAPPVSADVMGRATESVMRNERLDGNRQGFAPTRSQEFPDGKQKLEEVNWRKQREVVGPKRFWAGFTEFKLKPKVSLAKVREAFAANKGGDEVKECDIKPEEWPLWKVADGEGWAKVEASGAVKALSIEEPAEVESQLKEAGTISRVIPSTVARRWKPGELPGEPPTMKSRWCVRGEKDPDLLTLERYSPTVTTAIISVVLQTAASRRFRCAIGDLKNAFMQSLPLQRPRGRLFCRQPRGGLPGLLPGQLIEILAGAYGLGDAPAHWRKSLLQVLTQLGYQQSGMDSCTFRYFEDGKLKGIMVVEVEVGDLLTLGDEAHFAKMQELQRRFKFGKFKFLDEEQQGVSFNGRRLRMDEHGTYHIDMQKFIEERLSEVKLEVGRAAMKGENATEKERSDASHWSSDVGYQGRKA